MARRTAPETFIYALLSYDCEVIATVHRHEPMYGDVDGEAWGCEGVKLSPSRITAEQEEMLGDAWASGKGISDELYNKLFGVVH